MHLTHLSNISENLMHLIHIYPVRQGCLVLRKHNIHATNCHAITMQDNDCRARRGGFKLNKALYLSLHFQPKLLQVTSSKPSLSEKRSLIMVIKAGGVFLWRIWVTHIFHDSGGQFICLSSLPSIETSSERDPPPPLPGNSCMLRERQRKRARKKRKAIK